tara:strand:+ start:89 stop:352 length:264 start_codon:yes stop_codon:yes gene_type:complete
MSKSYCPFCSSSYPFHRTRSDGVLICGYCGDPLIKKPLLNSKRIIGVVLASAFLTPLLLLAIFVLKDFTKEKLPINSELLTLLIFEK